MLNRLFSEPVDPDLILRDLAIEHPSNAMRAIANCTIGMDFDNAYYSVRELREAVALLDQNRIIGKALLADILSADCVDYQRAIFFCLAGRGLKYMLDILQEFEQVLETRARVNRLLREGGVETEKLDDPYDNDFAFGPVCEAEFQIKSQRY